jgi:hypothetical protein
MGDTHEGTFIVRQKNPATSWVKAVDPIVSPGVFPSAHEHMGWCASDVTPTTTVEDLLNEPTLCQLPSDHNAYWMPTLYNSSGARVLPSVTFTYYKNLPVSYSTTEPFPSGLKMVAGGEDFPNPKTFWDCFDSNPPGKFTTEIPRCLTDDLQVRLAFPNCWDGVNLDSADHRSHVVFPVGSSCPMNFPHKIPFLHFFARWSPPAGGPGWHLSDGHIVPHADAFIASPLAEQVSRCLSPVGVNCGFVTN